MPDYIGVPIETDPDQLAQDAYDYLQSQVDGWKPAEGNLETIIMDTGARLAAEVRDLASRVPTSIFRYYGQMVNVVPREGAKATGQVTVTAIDNKGYVIPAATQVGFLATGDEMIEYEVMIDITIPPGATSATGTIIALDLGAAQSNVGGAGAPMQLITPIDYVQSVTMTSATSGGADAEPDADYINRLASRLRTMTDTPVLPNDFAILARDIPGVARAVAIDGYNPVHNLLSVNDASVETDISGWAVGAACTIVRSTTQAADGVASILTTALGPGDYTVQQATGSRLPVFPGDVFTALVSFRPGSTPRNMAVQLAWYDLNQGYLSATSGSFVTETAGGWMQAFVTGTAPSGAAFVSVIPYLTGPNGDTHYIDKMLLRRGTSTVWVPGGTSPTGNERMVMVVPVDENGEPVGVLTLAQVQSYLDSLREQNFIVNVANPTYSTIDVTATVQALPGFGQADVQSRIVDALTNYLSPRTWGMPVPGTAFGTESVDWNIKTVVRFREIDQVINDVVGVDYINDVTIGINGGPQASKTDVTLGGVVPLPRPGTLTATVTLG